MALARIIIPIAAHVNCFDDWKSVCAKANPCVFRLYCKKTQFYCGGFFINSFGYGISVYHFYKTIEKNLKDSVVVYNNQEYPFEIVYKSESFHLIILRIPNLKTPNFLRFSKDVPNLGTEVALFSVNPAEVPMFEPGYVLDLSYTKVQNVSFPCIRSSCRGGPGFSGGPLLSRQGSVLGIHKSYSTLFSVFDSISLPSAEIRQYLCKIGEETENGWEFRN
jgi:hypothetical protein